MSEFSLSEHFIIDGKVLFIPERRELRSLDASQLLTIQTPASECLKVLLAEQGEVIPRDKLIQASWGIKSANYISNNTFYQMVSHLRKMLEQMGCYDLVRTVPRKGLTMDSSILVECIKPEKNTPKKYSWILNNRLNIILFILILSITSLSGVLHFLISSKRVFNNYSSFRDDECDVYYPVCMNKEKANEILQPFSINCSKKHTVYISTSTNAVRRGVIICDGDSSNLNHCYTTLTVL